MMLCLAKINRQTRGAGFSLIETLIAFTVFVMISSGVIYGYVLSNRMAEWSAISLAAQSYASQGAEQARAADWRPHDYPQTNGYGTMDELSISSVTGYTNLPPQTNILDIPIKGDPSSSDFDFFVTTYVNITNISINPPLRQIRADAVWTFYVTGQKFTNTIILLRAPDQ